MKKLLSLILCFITILSFSSCSYNPPEGYSEEHHTYEEILAFAKSIDSNATVSKEYTDTIGDSWNRKFREYSAVINGIECHVSSVGDMVWNDGFLAGEFSKEYYVIDTDYDYIVLKKIVAERNPDWNISDDTLSNRYNWNNVISVYMEPNRKEQLTDEEIEAVLEQAKEIYAAYHTLPIRKELSFWLPAPEKRYNQDVVKRNSKISLTDFTEESKLAFIDSYHKAWALLDAGFPIYE